MDQLRAAFAKAGLTRPYEGRWLGGVAAGLAVRLGIDAWIVRLAFVLISVLPGSSLVLYVLLWICMPPTGWVAPVRTP